VLAGGGGGGVYAGVVYAGAELAGAELAGDVYAGGAGAGVEDVEQDVEGAAAAFALSAKFPPAAAWLASLRAAQLPVMG
jgi:hypothetical protein